MKAERRKKSGDASLGGNLRGRIEHEATTTSTLFALSLLIIPYMFPRSRVSCSRLSRRRETRGFVEAFSSVDPGYFRKVDNTLILSAGMSRGTCRLRAPRGPQSRARLIR